MIAPRTYTLALAGDVMLGRLVNQTIAQEGFAYPWGNMLPVIRGADLFLINLECALTARTEPWHDGGYKTFYFRADPPVIRTLKIAGVSFASVANNHAGDFGMAGLLETLQILDSAGVAHAGGGADLAEARVPATLQVDGLRVCVLAFADYPSVWAATQTGPGMNYTPVSVEPWHFAEIEQSLARAREQADLVIFSIHWGPNMRVRPPKEFRTFARKIVDSGADIFWGHSAHVVHGIEIHDGKVILYDTGDFVDDYAVDEALRNDLSALFLVRVKPPAIERIEIVPVRIDDMQVNLARGEEREWFIQRLRKLCAEMGTDVQTGPQGVSVLLAPQLVRETEGDQ